MQDLLQKYKLKILGLKQKLKQKDHTWKWLKYYGNLGCVYNTN